MYEEERDEFMVRDDEEETDTEDAETTELEEADLENEDEDDDYLDIPEEEKDR